MASVESSRMRAVSEHALHQSNVHDDIKMPCLTTSRRLQADVTTPGAALDLHVRRWRRFLEVPVEHMLAVQPDTARGQFRVGVWLTPEMTGPQAARLVALHAQYHVGVLGFHEEQARPVPLV